MIIPCFESQGQDNGFFAYTIPLDDQLVLSVACGTKKGIDHEEEVNEDNYCAVGPLLVVADGLGGHFRGDIGSRVVADCLYWYGQRTSELFPFEDRKQALMQYLLAQRIPAEKVSAVDSDVDALITGIQMGWNMDSVCTGVVGSARAILTEISPPESRGIDSTVVAAEFREGKIFWYHQGDSLLAHITAAGNVEALSIGDFGRNVRGSGLTATICSPNAERNILSQP